jgi:pimeloyl-ACP methyl ester carboxylesterase
MNAPVISEYCRGLGSAGFHRINYYQFGERDNPRVVICVHGLTRNGRDFDVLARRLARDFRVICPDVVGRGKSDWLADKSGYQYPQYVADMAVLIARSGAEQVDFVGTSMGGLIGMFLAAQPNTPVARLVMNDVGPHVPESALKRIGEYVGRDPRFDDIESLEGYLREICADFGPLTDSQWRHLATHGAIRREDGFAFAYDPAIARAFEGIESDVDLWPVWAAVTQEVLVLRGSRSDLLTRDTAERMLERDAPTELVEFDNVGHAPMLMSEDQVDVVAGWLDRTAR